MKEQTNLVDIIERHNRAGQWIYLAQVSGLRLTNAVHNEFRVNHVRLVSREKLPRIRKRLGIPQRISQIKQDMYRADFFEEAATFAVMSFSGKPDVVRARCREVVKRELTILSASQLGYQSRNLMSCPTIDQGFHTGRRTELLLSRNDAREHQTDSIVGNVSDMYLDTLWKRWADKMFFNDLLQILRGEAKIGTGWRDELQRATLLIGQSQCSTDLVHSFLWNMIALEVLLAKSDGEAQKYSELLPERAEALLGWVGFWEVDGYHDQIQEVYARRNHIVHRGKVNEITFDDLVFTDTLLLNLVINLVRHPEIFHSKDAVVEFSKKVQAEQILNAKPKVRPKSLHFVKIFEGKGQG